MYDENLSKLHDVAFSLGLNLCSERPSSCEVKDEVFWGSFISLQADCQQHVTPPKQTLVARKYLSSGSGKSTVPPVRLETDEPRFVQE